MALLSVDSVSKTYRTDSGRIAAVVLRDVSFNVSAGAFTSILGDPMSGKTTLLKIAAGIEAPDSGTVRLDGHDLPTSDNVDSRIALVTNTQLPRELANLTVRDLLALRSQRRSSRAGDQDTSDAALRALGISRLASSRWSDLSDVERSLVRLARAIALEPQVLLADDPMRGLSLTQIAHASAALLRLARDAKTAIVMTGGDLVSVEASDVKLSLSGGTVLGGRRARSDTDFRHLQGRGG